ncbi:LLM class flavin-dependent oxidoreductase [Georgenia thermotolerans]|uniref:LLM class flavin-dependent oxidoreductase n=1 Tax=Georgenia thermotolerans TaxID=527326 RepID=A0A7J5ULY9_9MICO|nr:LLM class flavin-dependent oxidoreductase [Georgenia thermotolerans]KAE8763300.1 LLM class flavin-dependent oxidoreductase [Georgenia thermotolerans]
MKFGLVGTFGSARQMVDLAVEAERAGWDGFFTWDGISVGEVDTFDPWTLLGAIAVRTSTIRLGAMVFSLPRRRPWKVAREALTVDHLSGGRLVIPVGLGATDDGGYSRVSGDDVDRRTRAERLDDTLAILERAWTGEPFSYTGAQYQVRDLVFRPRPVQRPRIPVWVVASWPVPRSMQRAVRWDGVLPSRHGDPFEPFSAAELREVVAWTTEQRAAAGRTGSFDVVVEGVLPDDPSAAAERVEELAAAGVTWWIESRWEGEAATPERLLERARRGPPRA